MRAVDTVASQLVTFCLHRNVVLLANIVNDVVNTDLCLSMLLSYVFSVLCMCCLVSNQTDNRKRVRQSKILGVMNDRRSVSMHVS